MKSNQKEDKKAAEPSFLDSILENEYAQIFMSAVPGAIILCVCLVIASILNIFVTSNWGSLVFLPIVCLFPLVAGLLATVLLRRVTKDEADVAHCAGTGALSGFLGAVLGALVLLVLLLLKKQALGGMVGTSTVFQVITLATIVIMSAILAALGAGALAFFFSSKKEGKKREKAESEE